MQLRFANCPDEFAQFRRGRCDIGVLFEQPLDFMPDQLGMLFQKADTDLIQTDATPLPAAADRSPSAPYSRPIRRARV